MNGRESQYWDLPRRASTTISAGLESVIIGIALDCRLCASSRRTSRVNCSGCRSSVGFALCGLYWTHPRLWTSSLVPRGTIVPMRPFQVQMDTTKLPVMMLQCLVELSHRTHISICPKGALGHLNAYAMQTEDMVVTLGLFAN